LAIVELTPESLKFVSVLLGDFRRIGEIFNGGKNDELEWGIFGEYAGCDAVTLEEAVSG